ncbi:MAG: fructose-bisphosphate aldolase, partial [Desulfobacter postgatei]|uniref:class I fructose-bisphosphate aldolase n=1 Tax=Desulfobacter postgatei TaxID=2293 RepID=UPI003C6C48A4|nr:fructose-bisphosphate aldolase [Desulfobacter postgatei]
MNGKERRLRKIINKKTGRSLVLAVDHGMALGAMTGIVDIAGTIRTLDATNKVDCWLMTKGIYTHAFNPSGDPGVILRASGGATIAGPELTREGQTADAEEALRLGVDAMATTAFVGSAYEHETLISMARMATECRKWDMPLLGVIGLGKTNEDKKKDPKFIA